MSETPPLHEHTHLYEDRLRMIRNIIDKNPPYAEYEFRPLNKSQDALDVNLDEVPLHGIIAVYRKEDDPDDRIPAFDLEVFCENYPLTEEIRKEIIMSFLNGTQLSEKFQENNDSETMHWSALSPDELKPVAFIDENVRNERLALILDFMFDDNCSLGTYIFY